MRRFDVSLRRFRRKRAADGIAVRAELLGELRTRGNLLVQAGLDLHNVLSTVLDQWPGVLVRLQRARLDRDPAQLVPLPGDRPVEFDQLALGGGDTVRQQRTQLLIARRDFQQARPAERVGPSYANRPVALIAGTRGSPLTSERIVGVDSP